MRPPFAQFLAVAAIVCSPVFAHDLGGGAKAPNGKTVLCSLTSWIPGTPARVEFKDAPTTTVTYVLIVSSKLQTSTIPGFNGWLMLDLSAGGIFYVTASFSVGTLSTTLNGTRLYIQGALIDQNGQGYFTPATEVDCFHPRALASNNGANTSTIIDVGTKKVLKTVKAGKFDAVFSRNRAWVYTVTLGSVQAIHLVTYGVTTISLTRPQAVVMHPYLNRLYVPTQMNGIAIIDTDPASTNFHKVIGNIKLPAGYQTRFHNPRAAVITPDGTKMFLAYYDPGIYPQGSNVGVVDLLSTGTPHRLIAVTNNGSISALGLTPRECIAMSPDGRFVYTIEWALVPGFGTVGWGTKKGGALNIIDAALEKEVAVISTLGYQVQHLHADRMGRTLWFGQVNGLLQAEMMRLNIDKYDTAINTLSGRWLLSATTMPTNAGPKGITMTPDSSQIMLTIQQGGPFKNAAYSFNPTTGKLVRVPYPVQVERLPLSLVMQQHLR